ncbi:MAG: hypothetical protein K6T83_18505 [Alicyclobacillus sp.]|nr:hypothetical protein [Alicyclobacillus sp.]
MELYELDVNTLFQRLDDWIQRHPRIQACEIDPIWKDELIHEQYDHPVIDIGVRLRTDDDQDVVHVTYQSSCGRGDFDLSYYRFRRFNAEALAYACLVATYLAEKGIQATLYPRAAAVAKLESFLMLSGEIIVG